jgi:hypothetical protein
MIYNYVIKGYTEEDFSNEFTSRKKDLDLIAQEIAQLHYNEDPCDPEVFECIVGIKKKDEDQPQWFTTTAEPEIRFHTRILNG